MATLTSVKNRADNVLKPFLFIFALFILCAATGICVWFFTRRWLAAIEVGLGTATLLGIWVYFYRVQIEISWLCRLQVMLLSIGALPKEYKFFDTATPKEFKEKLEDIIRTSTDIVQGAAKEIITQRYTMEKYLGSHASSQAARGAGPAVGSGQMQKVFILFSDIRGFTRMSEMLTAQETLRVLNQIYTVLGIAIEKQGGEINKFIGDAILAYFKRSFENERSEAQSVIRAALEMQDRFRTAVKNNTELSTKNISVGLGIGIVAGEAILGNLGSRNRMEFTLIGDSVNLASRLCGIAPEDEILVNEELALLVNDKFHIESRPAVQLKGKSEKTIPYSIMGDVSNRISSHL